MTFARLLLILAVLLVPTVRAQEGLVRFPALGKDPHYPYELQLRNESAVRRTVRLEEVRARLAPVTPDLGRVSRARLVFPPRAPRLITLPPKSSNEVAVPFRLQTAAPRGVYALELDLPGESIWDNPPGFDPVIDYPLAHAPHLRVPETYRRGQRFLSLGAVRGYRHNGRPLGYHEGHGRLFTLTGYRGGTARFKAEGLARAVTLRTSSRSRFPGLAPLLHDPALAGLRRAYVGKRAWAYGGFELSCAYGPGTRLTFSGPPRAPLRVRRVWRVAWPVGLSLAGTAGAGGYNPASPGDLTVATPLVVQFEKSARLAFSSAYGGGNLDAVLADASDAALLRRCPPLSEFVADAWQLPTVLSLKPPPELPRVRDEASYLGLTHSQYAWLVGYPTATFGKLPQLLELRRWQYASIPFPITVTFDRRGRVVVRDVPRLP